ncbi:hypothetical protein MN116_007904 [Schistosoma mekongi]|uniref:EF-hand domain-containing protein n=1 Tax=Schistosoma mekongi TaxID=38744 RepID=A0AAE1Z8D6_SCHME|nr:hypothetical protein MN116_007904 [Schistosoma mekongi]
MIGMLDCDANRTTGFNEFCKLSKYVQDWQTSFRKFDRDNSGSVGQNELNSALSSLGYSLSPQFVSLMINHFDRNRRGSIEFDDFIYAYVCLQALIIHSMATTPGFCGFTPS